eukprot:3726910-Rhodomonas_salina.1
MVPRLGTGLRASYGMSGTDWACGTTSGATCVKFEKDPSRSGPRHGEIKCNQAHSPDSLYRNCVFLLLVVLTERVFVPGWWSSVRNWRVRRHFSKHTLQPMASRGHGTTGERGGERGGWRKRGGSEEGKEGKDDG